MSCQQISLAEEFLAIAQVFLLTRAMKGMRPAHSTVLATFLLLSITHIQSLAQQQKQIRNVEVMWGKRKMKMCRPSRLQPTNLKKFSQIQRPRFQDLEATLPEIPYHYAWRPSPKNHRLGQARNGCKRRFGRTCVAKHLGCVFADI